MQRQEEPGQPWERKRGMKTGDKPGAVRALVACGARAVLTSIDQGSRQSCQEEESRESHAVG